MIAMIEKAPIEPFYPVSLQQEGVWLQSILDPDKNVWNTCHTWRYEGELNIKALKKAIEELLQRHELLKTNFKTIDLHFFQFVNTFYSVDDFFLFIDLSAFSYQEAEYKARLIEQKEANRVYDIYNGPLIRFVTVKLAPNDFLIIIGKHHIISDVTSRMLLLKELSAFYNAIISDSTAQVEPLSIQYYDYSVWQRRFVETPNYHTQREYWLSQLSGTLPVLNFPTDYPREENLVCKTIILEHDLEPGFVNLLRTFTLRKRVSFSSVFWMAYYIFLSKWTGQSDIVIGTLFRGRNIDKKNLPKIIGLFANRAAVRMNFENNLSILELLSEVDTIVRNSYDNQEFLFEDLIRILHPERSERHAPLFQVIFNMIKAPVTHIDFNNLTPKPWKGYEVDSNISARYDLSLFVVDNLERIRLKMLYPEKLYEEPTVRVMIQQYILILKAITSNPSAMVSDIDMTTEEEKSRIIETFNNTTVDFSYEKGIHQLFEDQVLKTPDSIALLGSSCNEPGMIQENVSLTYSELNNRAEMIAFSLIENGTEPGSIIPIMIDRYVERFVGIYGILKAGAAYLPIDIEFPQERIDYILKDSCAGIILTTDDCISGNGHRELRPWREEEGQRAKSKGQSERRDGIGDSHVVIPVSKVTLGRSSLPMRGCVPLFQGSRAGGKSFNFHTSHFTLHTCYVIYTSGTTGKPKGVLIDHYSLVNRILWMQKQYRLEPQDIILHKTAYTFDVSVWEVFWWAIVGARVDLLVPKGEKNPEAILDAIVKNRVSVMHFVPSMLGMFLEYIKSSDGHPDLSSLRQVVSSGEALTVFHVKTFKELLYDKYDTRLANLYGPTEATIDVSYYDCFGESGDVPHVIPIGKPVDNTVLYIVDMKYNLQPIGVSGELVIGGVQVGRGYLNKTELTAEKFITVSVPAISNFCRGESPCSPGKTEGFSIWGRHGDLPLQNGQACQSSTEYPKQNDSRQPTHTHTDTHTLYKTGDLARWMRDGNIECLGRIDMQVKIRGYRIELEEIESVLLRLPGIKGALVNALSDQTGGKFLCAYIIPTEGSTVDSQAIRQALGQVLPEYMIPLFFIPMETFPLTSSNKIDRKALPKPGNDANREIEYEPPSDEMEHNLVSIWQEVLEVERIGVNDNFFTVGGESIKAIRIVSLMTMYGYKATINIIFKNPTVKLLAGYLKQETTQGYPVHAPASRLDLEKVSPEELERIYRVFPKDQIETVYDLTPMQEGMLFHCVVDTQSHAYIVQFGYTLEGEVDAGLLRISYEEIIDAFGIFRTTFVYKDLDRPRQVVLKKRPGEFKYYDLSLESSLQKQFDEIRARDWERGFDLSNEVLIRIMLFKLQPSLYAFVGTFHHIIMDGWSTNLFLKELVTHYRKLRAGEVFTARDENPFSRYLKWLGTRDMDSARQYWKEYLAPFDQLSLIQPINQDMQDIVFKKNDYTIPFEESFGRRLIETAKQLKVTVNNILQAVWYYVLHRYTGIENVVSGNVVSGRNIPVENVEKIIGLFINTVPVGIHIDPMQEFPKLAVSVQEKLIESMNYGHLPLAEIRRYAPVEGSLFEHLYIYENYPIEQSIRSNKLIETTGFNMSGRYTVEQNNYHLNLVVVPRANYIVRIQFDENKYNQEFIKTFGSHIRNVIQQVLDDPHIKLSQIELLSPEEKELLIVDFNNTSCDYPREKTLHQVIHEQAERTPYRIAIAGRSMSPAKNSFDENVHISYDELDERSGFIASELIENGVRPGSLVPVMMNRYVELLIIMFGILKSGAGYLPIDPEYPRDRVDYMLKDANVSVLSLTEHTENAEEKKGDVKIGDRHVIIPILNVTLNKSFWSNLFTKRLAAGGATQLKTQNSKLKTSSSCYIIYTSGSTGKPKGVIIPHGAVLNFIEGMTQRIDFREGKAILGLTTISFDIFVLETWVPLSIGMKIILAGEEEQRDPLLLERMISRQGIDMLQITPTRMQMLIGQETPITCLNYLKEIMIGGEAFPGKLLADLKRLTSAKIYNMYGPTETTVWSAVKDLTSENEVRIGKPIANTFIFILDKMNRFQPVGVAGELCIGGEGVSIGYLNSPEKTAERFVSMPPAGKTLFEKRVLHSQKLLPGVNKDLLSTSFNSKLKTQNPKLSLSIYRTGDLACWLPGGEIRFYGRIDTQVKIRGFRIELGEIENVLNQFPGIKESVVIAVDMVSEGISIKTLCAYLRMEVFGEEPTLEALREFLGKHLPDYMVPGYFVVVEKIPLTPNGKLDRKALPAPTVMLRSDVRFEKPSDEVEEKLSIFWQEILEIGEVGIHDNFINLGGHSLRVLSLVNRISREMEVELQVRDVFDNPTIAGLAVLIREDLRKSAIIERILNEVEVLSDTEILEKFPGL